MRRTHISGFGRGLERLEARENPSGFGSLNFFSLPRTFSGTVYADANTNGVQDAGEGGVNGLTVYVDANNNGVRDAGEPSTVTAEAVRSVSQNGVTTTSHEPGYYFLNAGRNVPAGAVVRVDVPAGATQTTPPPAVPAGLFTTGVDLGVGGVTASVPTAPSTTAPNNGTVSTSGSSSAGAGVATISVSSSTTGNGLAFGFATSGDRTIYVG